jgi:T5SS/PEP-CTERM-associated repeat protein
MSPLQDGGGTISNIDGTIGTKIGSISTVTVDGAGSTWVNSDQLRVGNAGNGFLTISDGGVVSNAGLGQVARDGTSTGTVTVTGIDSTWTNSQSLYVGGGDLAAGGTGIVTVETGATVDVTSTLQIWGPGTVNLAGGTINTGSLVKAGSTLNLNDGLLLVDGGVFDNGTDPDLTIDGANAGDADLTWSKAPPMS